MEGPGPRVYRRTVASRVVSSAVLVLSSGFLAWFLLGGEEPPMFTLVLLGFFLVVSSWLTLVNFGDRIALDAEGIRIRNRFLEPLGWGRRDLPWDEVRSLREHRKRVLFLGRKGRRSPFVLDSLERWDEVVQVVQARTGIQLPPRPEDG